MTITYTTTESSYDGRTTVSSFDATTTVNGQDVSMCFDVYGFESHDDVREEWDGIVDVDNILISLEVSFAINGILQMQASTTNRITIVKMLKEMFNGLVYRATSRLRTPGRDVLLYCTAFADNIEGGDESEALRIRMYRKSGFTLHEDDCGHVMYRVV